MTYAKSFGETLTLRDGSQVVQVVCGKCGGSGYLPGYEYIDGARCWGCGAKGILGHVTLAERDKILRRREQDRARRAAKAEAKAKQRLAEAVQEQAQRTEQFLAWSSEHQDVVAFLNAAERSTQFVRDMIDLIRDLQPLTEGQVAAVRRSIATLAAATEVPAGRQEVQGTVISVKCTTNAYTGRPVTKIIVDCGTFRVYGTAPAALLWAVGDDAEATTLKGRQVAFTATLEPGRDKGFGFYQRATKARLVTA